MALNGTMVAIQTVTVGSGGAANITFSNIPQTYTDLKVVYSVRNDATGTSNSIFLSLNGSTSSFSRRNLYGDGSSAASAGGTSNEGGLTTVNSFTASTFSNGELYIPNYTSSNNKSISGDAVNENNATLAYTFLVASIWSNTAAITSLGISPNAGNFVQHSSATLYGISRTTDQIKATGGMVYDTDTHIYHLFNGSGVFTPTQNLTVDYLVVAGGGGGGKYYGGGGGAGGYREASGFSVTSNTNYTVTVGAGGAFSTANGTKGSSGNNSVFSTITSSGGGGGGSRDTNAGSAGGSGGGGSFNDGTNNQGAGGAGNAGSYSPSEGNAGSTAVFQGGGGGGGSGAASTNSKNGGNGTASSITGSSVTRAGGGGASAGTPGTGGTGGGGNGASDSVAGTNGETNTGSGGGGASSVQSGGNGGSGVVIVRYAK
jgi:hypothetical protein